MTLHVGIVCHFPPPPGGMPAQAEALVEGLTREGIEVRRIATNLTGGPVARRLDRVRMIRTLVRVPAFLLRLMCALPRLGIVHALSGSGLSFWLFTAPAILASAAMGKRTVLHYHGGEAHAFFRRWPRAVRFVASKADCVIVPSRFIQDAFAALDVPALIVPNLCDTDRFVFSEPPPGPEVLLVARHLEPIYNVSAALRAFAAVKRRHPDAQMIVAGGGSQEGQLRTIAQTLGIAGSVRFTGYIAHDQMQRLYRASTIFVNSSNADNFPISILEAFSSGLPVVTTAAGGIPMLVHEGLNGLLAPVGDHDALAHAIDRVISDPPLRERLRVRARQDAEAYSWRHVYPRLHDVYNLIAPVVSVATH